MQHPMTSLLEESAQQTSRKIIHNPTPQSAPSKRRRLTKLVTPGEGHRVGHGQDEGDDCSHILIQYSHRPSHSFRKKNLPTKLSQITLINLTSARIANAIHSAGAAYRLSQKNRRSVELMARVLGSEDSKTQCESPVAEFTSFHQRRPTRRRPAMFLR